MADATPSMIDAELASAVEQLLDAVAEVSDTFERITANAVARASS